MYGPHVDTLNVYTKKSGQLGQPIFTKNGSQGNLWNHATVVVSSLSSFQVKRVLINL